MPAKAGIFLVNKLFMSKNLVIVESPAKAKTIKKYLGKDFEVLASYGHVRDLKPKEGAVDPDNDFAMKYQVIDRNGKHVDAIAKALKKADALYLATDPDREGEAISWHLLELLKNKKLLKDKEVGRVVFHEITKKAIREAVENPRELAMELVNAQQARRALDYLVGFNLSPLLWKKIRRGLSAGRVQSPALRLIVEREEEIERFVPREYWSVEADVSSKGQNFNAKLIQFEGEKVEQFTIDNSERADQVESTLLREAEGKLEVTKVVKKQRKRNPAAPFTTSTLQQEASRKLGFTAQRTMRTAQQLYEGIDIGGETVGLITYMRTDSVNLAAEAMAEVRDYIAQRYGSDNVPPEPRTFKTKSKNAQEAHEAIRPTSIERVPSALQGHLSKDQFRLYELIWKRTLACQMVHATLDTVAVDLAAGEGNLFLERPPEAVHQRHPLLLAARDRIELVLQLGGEVVVDVLGEVVGEELVHHPPHVGGDETALVHLHILARLQGGDDAGIGRGAADAELLQRLDQARLGEARRWLGEVLLGADGDELHLLPLQQLGQQFVVVVLLLGIVHTLLVDRHEAGMDDG